jgi:hypothetical protein
MPLFSVDTSSKKIFHPLGFLTILLVSLVLTGCGGGGGGGDDDGQPDAGQETLPEGGGNEGGDDSGQPGAGQETPPEDGADGGSTYCPDVQPGIGGIGGVENYPYFPAFDSSGARLRHTLGTISYIAITDEETKELKKKIAGYPHIAFGDYYEKCNVEPGMHAKVVFGRAGDDYALELTLFGNGGFVPNAEKFQEVFGEIESAPGFFYVSRDYETDMSARFEKYMTLADDAYGYGCNAMNCGTSEPERWFNKYTSNWMDWHIDFRGE